MDSILAFSGSKSWWLWIIIVMVLMALRDIIQRKHTISYNFPVIGHIRYFMESFGTDRYTHQHVFINTVIVLFITEVPFKSMLKLKDCEYLGGSLK
jgi:hypothetical protein